ACSRAGSITRTTFDTTPTWTPRNVTAAPGARPPTEPSKNTTALSLVENASRPPKNRIAATTSARPPSRKPPRAAGLDDMGVLPSGGRPRARSWRRAPHECLNGWMGRGIAQRARRAVRDRGLGLGVEKHAVVADGEQARQLVADQHHGGAETVAQLEDELVK